MRSDTTNAGLLLVRSCGEKICDPYQYCSVDGICLSCSPVCNTIGNNFDSKICEARCQDYIHDKIKHYLTEADSLKATKDLQETIELLRKLVAASLVTSAVVVLLVVALLGYIWLKFRGKRYFSKRSTDMDLMDQKINTVSAKDKPLQLDMPPPSGNSSTAAPSVITAVTPISTRHPSEDVTLEYGAYDNQGMTPSPILPVSTTVITGNNLMNSRANGCFNGSNGETTF
ncbi:hypothetical protein O3M35_001802 [Rhynocoris fuscipes]|uniref:Protein grindelwald n=1 Tax=Rhynocoris fuscipes TaxID=488301 RepID=A0AAW1CS39_9HEMI